MLASEVFLEAKTRKARNRLAELRQKLGQQTNPGWKVMQVADRVSFSGDSGPWLLLTPSAMAQDASAPATRWVHAQRDADFTVCQA